MKASGVITGGGRHPARARGLGTCTEGSPREKRAPAYMSTDADVTKEDQGVQARDTAQEQQPRTDAMIR